MKKVENLKDLLFPVRKLTTREFFNKDIDTLSETEYCVVGTVDGKDKLLNVCTSKYRLVPNDKFFPIIEDRLHFAGIKYEATYKHIDNAKFYVDYIIKDESFAVGNENDKIYPKIRAMHSYNGKMNYTLAFGWFRILCSNGLAIPVKEKESESFHIVGKHTEKIEESITELLSYMDRFLKLDKKPLLKFYETLAERKIEKYEDRVEAVIKATKYPKGLVDKANPRGGNFIHIINEIEFEATTYNLPITDWLIYNALNSVLYNDNLNKKHDEIRYDQDVKVLEYIIDNK